MRYLVLVIIAIAAVELFMLLPIWRPIQAMLSLGRKIPRVLGSRHVSDHWKEKVLQRYARDLALNSLRVFAWLLLALALLTALTVALDSILTQSASTLDYLAGTEGIIVISLLSLAYYWLRYRLGQTRV